MSDIIVRKLLKFDMSAGLFGKSEAIATPVPDGSVIKLLSVNCHLDLVALTGAANGKAFDVTPNKLLCVVGSDLVDFDRLHDLKGPINLEKHAINPYTAFGIPIGKWSDTEGYIESHLELHKVPNPYLCSLEVAIGRDTNTAVAKSPSIECLFEVRYEVVKMTTSIMQKMHPC